MNRGNIDSYVTYHQITSHRKSEVPFLPRKEDISSRYPGKICTGIKHKITDYQKPQKNHGFSYSASRQTLSSDFSESFEYQKTMCHRLDLIFIFHAIAWNSNQFTTSCFNSISKYDSQNFVGTCN